MHRCARVCSIRHLRAGSASLDSEKTSESLSHALTLQKKEKVYAVRRVWEASDRPRRPFVAPWEQKDVEPHSIPTKLWWFRGLSKSIRAYVSTCFGHSPILELRSPITLQLVVGTECHSEFSSVSRACWVCSPRNLAGINDHQSLQQRDCKKII